VAWPRCPVCRRRDGPDWRLILVDRALGTFGADDEVNRSHLCPCGARWLTVEAVTSVNPPTPRLRGKYDLSQPADTTPLPSATSSATLESLPPSGSRKLKGAE
jgi:hypothetical protein